MGVPGLLKALADVQRQAHVSEYRGLRVGVDGYCLLHRGKHACAEALLAGETTTAFLRPLLDVVALLRGHGVEPLLVFDGGPLPAKRHAEEARQGAREAAQWKAAALLRAQGAGATAQATKLLGSSIEVTPEMAAAAVRRLTAMGVECVVAPCEADAQLAHLALTGRIDVCCTEDVDLLAYGCPRVLFGLDTGGHGREVRLEDLGRSRGLSPYRFSPETLPDLCVLGGCDYIAPVPRLGVKTAAQLLHRSGGDVARALQLARREGFAVPADYPQRFTEARLVFTSQLVFNLDEGRLTHLRPLPPGAVPPPGFLGPEVSDDMARDIAAARVHPVTLLPFLTVAEAPGTPALGGSAPAAAAAAATPKEPPVAAATMAEKVSFHQGVPQPAGRAVLAAIPRPLLAAVGGQKAAVATPTLAPGGALTAAPDSETCVAARGTGAAAGDAEPASAHQVAVPVPAAAAAPSPAARPFRAPRPASPGRTPKATGSPDGPAKRRRLGCRVTLG